MAMFRKLRTSTKLLMLCGMFLVSIGVPVYALVAEKLIAIEFARKELVGSRYLATVRATFASILTVRPGSGSVEGLRSPTDTAVQALTEAEARTGGALQTAGIVQSLAAALRMLEAERTGESRTGHLELKALVRAQGLARRVGDDSNLALNDGLRASEVIAGVRAVFKKDAQEKAPLEVVRLAEDVVALLHSELQGGRISVLLERSADMPDVLANRVQLQQVLLNLITNAIDGMRRVHDRPRELRIKVGTDEPGSVTVRVEDSGAGIDPQVRDRIFDPFFTTKSGGMGLGLSICRSIVEAHDGRVWVSAGDPHGSVLQFSLPACKQGEA